MANFNVDTSGNVWIGTGVSNTFSTAQGQANTKFYVTSAGSIFATSGTIGGISINSGDIQANYSAGSSGFLIESDGDAFFNSVTVNNPIITIGKVTSGTPSAASSTSLKLGDALLFSRDEGSTGNHLFSTKPFVVMADGSEDNPSLTIQGDFQKMGFFLETNNDFNFDSFKASNGNDDIFSFSSSSTDFSVLGDLNLSAALKAGGQSGTSGQVLQSTGNGVAWANTSGHTHGNLTFPNAGTLVTNQNVSTAHGTHADSNYLTNNNHQHGNTMTPNNHNHNFGNDITGFTNNNHNHTGQFMPVNHTLNSINPHGITGNNHNHSNYANNTDVANAITQHRFDVSHSDERLKEDIAPITLGLDFLNRLTPRDFNWKSSHLDALYNSDDSMDLKYKGMTSNLQQGFIAQEVKQAVFDETGSNTSFSGLKIGDITEYDSTISSDADDMGRIEMENFIPPLVKAVQQLSAKIDVLEARIDELEG